MNRRTSILAAITLASAVLVHVETALAPQPEQRASAVREGFRVSGRVTNEPGQPVAGVVVKLYEGGSPRNPRRTTVTRPDGNYEFTEVAPGPIDLEVVDDRHISLPCWSTVEADTVANILAIEHGTVTGTVSFQGRPPDRLQVLEHSYPPPPAWVAREIEWDREQGTFRFSAHSLSTHYFHLGAPGYAPSRSLKVDLPAGGELSVGAVALTPGGSVAGVFRDQNYAPVPGCTVSFDHRVIDVKADDTGSYIIESLPPGRQKLHFAYPEPGWGMRTVQKWVEVREGVITIVDFRVP